MIEIKPGSFKENSSDLQANYNAMPVGEILRRVRLQFNLTHEQVEDSLRIRAIYLDALEKGDFGRLPGQIYVSGFVKAYSEFLGLDSAKMIQLLKHQTGHRIERPTNIFPVTTDEQKLPSKKVVIISGILLLSLLLGWRLSNSSIRSDEIPAVPKQLVRLLTAPQKPVEAPKPKEATAAVVTKPHPVVLKALQDVWLEIRDTTGQPVFSRVLKQGEEYWVPADATGYKMTTGNSGGLQMTVEGKVYPTWGRVGEVKRNISLNAADLKVLLPPPQ